MNKTKKRLSLFSFGLSNDSKENLSGITPASPSNKDAILPPPMAPPLFNRSSSSISSATGSIHANAPESIFERSVQDSVIFEPQHVSPFGSAGSTTNLQQAKRSLSYSHNSSISLKTGQFLKNEDYIAPALDATTHLLANNKNSELDNIEMIYSNRRNSSVLGLNMALGRPFTPSRKNSSYSMHQISTSPTNNIAATSPTSPSKLNSSSSSTVSFYSYADMINNEDGRRPSFKSSYSQGFIPTMNSPASSQSPTLNGGSLKLKNGRGRTNTQKKRGFLISPESSDEERDQSTNLDEKSINTTSNNLENDGENLVSSSIGECLRQTRTEINSTNADL